MNLNMNQELSHFLLNIYKRVDFRKLFPLKAKENLKNMKRAYPTDNSFINLFSPRIDENLFGRMVKTAVINKLHAISFWKNGNEIDVINDNIPLEVKYQEKINLSDYKSLLEFMKKF